MPDPKRIAAVVTEYRRWSHADVILGKILEGYHHDRKSFPNLRLVSMYCRQLGGRAMDVRPLPRADVPVHGRLADSGDLAPAAVALAEKLRADRGGRGRLRPVRGLRLSRPGRLAVHGRATARRRDGRARGA